MAGSNSYEEQRRRQVEENRRKLDELRLHRLSAAVREAAAKPLPMKPMKLLRKARPPQGAPVRRSGRLASLPGQSDYRDVDVRSGACITKRELPDRVYVTNEERAYAIAKAGELADKLGSDFPTFVRPMTHNYVTKATNLGVPLQALCEVDGEFDILHYVNKWGKHFFNAGWRGFVINHKLVDGDCLVFQLIERTKFKVYIIRASSY